MKKTNIMEKAYREALDEDAVMSAGDVSPIGDVSTSTPTVDTDIVKSPGISQDDVLGKYDSEKGVFGNKDFNIPKNILGKGKIMKRFEIQSKKLKGHKNPYISNMKIINEKTIDEFMESITECLDESDNKNTIQTLKQLRQTLKNPTDLDEFINKHQAEIDDFQNNSKQLNLRQKSVFARIWESLKYAAKRGWQFVKKHWWKILLLVLIIALIIWGGQTDQGIKWGTKLFGDGYGKAVDGIKQYGKSGIQHIKKIIPHSISSTTTSTATNILNDLLKVKKWIPIDNLLLNPKDVAVGLKGNVPSSEEIWKHVLTDGRDAYSFGNDPQLYIPET